MDGWSIVVLLLKMMLFIGIEGIHQRLSRGKPSWQSSTTVPRNSDPVLTGTSERALDDAGNETCSCTNRSLISWWVVDLLDEYLIDQVAITPRSPGGGSPNGVVNFAVDASLYINATSGVLINAWRCYQQEPALPQGQASLLSCSKSAMGRYVQITKFRNFPSALSLCHVDVIGTTTERRYDLIGQPGKRASKTVIRMIQSDSSLVCLNQCLMEPGCTSFNRATVGGLCELIADTEADFDRYEQSEEGWTRYVKGNLASRRTSELPQS